MADELTLDELEVMRLDLVADLTELHETLSWIEREQLRLRQAELPQPGPRDEPGPPDPALSDESDLAPPIRRDEPEQADPDRDDGPTHPEPAPARHVPRQDDGKRGYTRVSADKVYLYIRDNGWVTERDIADYFGVSTGTAYNKVKALYADGRLMKSSNRGRAAQWHICKPGVPVEQPKPKQPARRPSLRLVSGVPGTGRQHPNARKRRGANSGTTGMK
jgi:hypothetical protein